MKRSIFIAVLFAVIGFSTPVQAQLYVARQSAGVVGKYNLETGASVAASLISSLPSPVGLAMTEGKLFVVSLGTGSNGRVGAYNPATGAESSTGSATLISPLNNPASVAASGGSLWVVPDFPASNAVLKFSTAGVMDAGFANPAGTDKPIFLAADGNDLYVSSYGSAAGQGKVGKYNATTGATINASLITGLTEATGVAVADGKVYVASKGPLAGSSKVGVYDASTGSAINGSLVLATQIFGIHVVDGVLWVADNGSAAVGKYNASTGAAIDATFIDNVTGIYDALAIPTPTPAKVPTVAIKKTPKVTTKPAVTIKGTASSTAVRVMVQVGKAKPKKARGTKNWTFSAKLKPGKNVITAVAIDSEGRKSKKAIVRITRK